LAIKPAEDTSVLLIDGVIDPELQDAVLKGVAEYDRPILCGLTVHLGQRSSRAVPN
jgi:hypothetical protein